MINLRDENCDQNYDQSGNWTSFYSVHVYAQDICNIYIYVGFSRHSSFNDNASIFIMIMFVCFVQKVPMERALLCPWFRRSFQLIVQTIVYIYVCVCIVTLTCRTSRSTFSGFLCRASIYGKGLPAL